MALRVINQFEIKRLEILDESGAVDQALEPDLGEQELLDIYRYMVLARELDQKMLKLQRQGRIGTFAPSSGQEAVAVGSAYAMGDRDWFVGAFRELGGRLVRGEPLTNPLLYHNGYEEGSLQPDGKESRLLPISVIVGSHPLHAVGIGFALKQRAENAAAVTVFGDGATSEGDFHEALNFAAVWKTPTVFVCQNNQWAISVPRTKQTRSETIAQKAIAYGMPGIQVDGNDVLAMYVATKNALQRAYEGGGPTLIEAETYRVTMHTTADDPRKYRNEDEVTPWKERDPIQRFRRYLEQKGSWDSKRQAELERAVTRHIEAAVTELESGHEFAPDAPFEHVFGTPHPYLEQQRAEFRAEMKREESDAKNEHG